MIRGRGLPVRGRIAKEINNRPFAEAEFQKWC